MWTALLTTDCDTDCFWSLCRCCILNLNIAAFRRFQIILCKAACFDVGCAVDHVILTSSSRTRYKLSQLVDDDRIVQHTIADHHCCTAS